MCTYTGPALGAAPGPCTETAGYISKAEINDIIAHHPGVQTFHDAASDSDVVVYDSVQWIAYMSDATKATHTAMYKGLNMGGVSDWAVDLQASLAPPSPTAPTPPAESGNFSDPIGPNGWMNPYLQNCTIEQADMINEAWLEAATLAQYHYEWWANQKWQDAMTLRGVQPPASTYSYFYCYEPDVPKANDPGFKPTPYVVFCPLWFSEKLISLRNKTGTANGDINMQTTMDYWRPVRARSIFHETYHWKTTVSEPRCLDYAYKALAVTNLAGTTVDFIEGSDLVEIVFDSAPTAWNPPVLNMNQNYRPDMTNVVMLWSIGALTSGGDDAADDDDIILLTDTAGSLSLTDALKSKGEHVAKKKARRGNLARKATTPSAAA
ncbi:hypothetical protein B0H14DRAFT_2568148 [Mycena olivaceomarginata]|nr:hypothetical protein B0H14DRAFT_2568148 [Mycena olivaceomarginata]